MERTAVNAASRWRADHDRDASPPAVAALRGEAHDLVVATGDEVGELKLGNRPQPHEARADGCSDNRGFSDGCIHDTALAKLLEKTGRHFEGAAVRADVLPDEEDIGIALH